MFTKSVTMTKNTCESTQPEPIQFESNKNCNNFCLQIKVKCMKNVIIFRSDFTFTSSNSIQINLYMYILFNF